MLVGVLVILLTVSIIVNIYCFLSKGYNFKSKCLFIDKKRPTTNTSEMKLVLLILFDTHVVCDRTEDIPMQVCEPLI